MGSKSWPRRVTSNLKDPPYYRLVRLRQDRYNPSGFFAEDIRGLLAVERLINLLLNSYHHFREIVKKTVQGACPSCPGRNPVRQRAHGANAVEVRCLRRGAIPHN